MPEIDIVKRLASQGYMIEPRALDLLSGRGDVVDRLLAAIDPAAIVVTAGDVERLFADTAAAKAGPEKWPETLAGTARLECPASPAGLDERRSPGKAGRPASPVSLASPVRPEGPYGPGVPGSPTRTERAYEVKILSDITNNSTCIGDYDEFVGFFRSRYSVLGEMIRGRVSARPIEHVRKNGRRNSTLGGGGNGEKIEVSIIGMVGDVRATANGHRIVELEDQTGSVSVLLSKDGPLAGAPVLLDEVVGVTGQPSMDGGLFIASSITYPDVPYTNQPRRAEEPAVVALLSDIHVGSDTFMEDQWLQFLDWLNEGEGDLVSRLRYLVIAGDLVDGIGIYPGQEKELTITDVYDQYARAAEYIGMMPKHLRVVIAPGNHDAVRQAEPQPALTEEVRGMFKGGNVTFVGNPSAVEIEGVRVLIYHGRSLDDLVSSLPGTSYAHPELAMAELLKRRHLSPIYGGRVMIAPESRDHFVIDPLPDIIHSGHVHTVGVTRYRGVLLANSGTWQGQTEFQKRMNIQPDPCRIPLVDLKTGEVKIVKFGE
jgi:DNA polymerase II small subunit